MHGPKKNNLFTAKNGHYGRYEAKYSKYLNLNEGYK